MKNIFPLKKNKKWDGHTHSEFCPHADIKNTALMVESAIKQGFQRYSITEHAPLPKEFLSLPTTPKNSSILENQLQNYFLHLEKIKKTYKDKIEVLLGLEVDYLIGMESYTQNILTQIENYVDEIIYSLHFIPSDDGNLKILDKSATDWETFFPSYNLEKLWEVYWHSIRAMLQVEWNFSRPIRIGHLNLIEKYSKKFPVADNLRKQWILFIQKEILPLVVKRGYSLDWNTSGLRKEYCGRVYWYNELTENCRKLKIPFVFGSDAHAVSDVGAGYELYQKL